MNNTEGIEFGYDETRRKILGLLPIAGVLEFLGMEGFKLVPAGEGEVTGATPREQVPASSPNYGSLESDMERDIGQ